MTLESLFNVLTGGRQAEDAEQPDTNPLGALLGGSGGLDLGGMLGGLLGREKAEANDDEDNDLAQLGLSPAILQAGLTLVLGRLKDGDSSAAGGLDLGALLRQAGEEDETDEEAVAATGLPGQLAALAGIDLDDALKAIQTILALLAGKKPTTRKRSTTSKSKAKTTRKSTTRKKATTAKATTRKAATSKATTSKARKTKESAASGAKRSKTKRATTKKDADDTDEPKRAKTSRAKSKTTSKAKPAKTTTKRTTRKKSLGETLALPADMVDVLKKPAGE
jgi:hypothetical protein